MIGIGINHGIGIGGGGVVATPYSQEYVRFDGSDDLYLNAALASPADLTQFSMVCWINIQAATAGQAYHLWYSGASGTTVIQLNRSNTNIMRCRGFNGGVQQFTFDSSTTLNASTGLICAMVSAVSGGASQMYWGDTSQHSGTAWAANAVDMSIANQHRFGYLGSGNRLNANVGYFAFYPTAYDFSVEANRRLFYSASGNPVQPPSGAIVQFGVDQPATSWNAGTNQGSGGGTFTMTGAVTDV